MANTKITIPVKLDAKTFKRFGWFDMFVLRRRWVRPLVFALILIAFAVVALLSGRAQAGLIAAVLMAVGLGLPLVWFGSFLSQVNLQAEKLRLDNPRPVYTLTLDYDGVRVVNNMRKEDAQVIKWADVQAAFRRKDCIYIYVSTVRAYLLPNGQADVSDDALWTYLKEHLGDKCK
jgi:hypothetical protein